jgi:hypothetical protein
MNAFNPARIRPNPANDPFTWILAGFPRRAKSQKVAFFSEINIIFRLLEAIRPESGQIRPRAVSERIPRSCVNASFPTPRHAVSYIMDTFPIVKRKDEAKHGTYRTKQTILQIYDALAESIATGTPYQTLLNPPPADPACCHPPRTLIPTSH